MNGVWLLFRRDFGRCLNKRFLALLMLMVLFQVWFIIGSGSAERIGEGGSYSFMAVVFSFNILGSLAALSLNFDSISRERSNKVMDMLLTAGLSKGMVMSGKITAAALSALLFSLLYNLMVFLAYVALGSGMSVLATIIRYVLPVTAFIIVYNLLGVLFSIVFRSSKTSFIVSMSVGLLMMPRILELFVKGIANVFGAGNEVSERLMIISPAVMINSLTGFSGQDDAIAGLVFLAAYLVLAAAAIVVVFIRQDELSYNEAG